MYFILCNMLTVYMKITVHDSWTEKPCLMKFPIDITDDNDDDKVESPS